MMFLKNMRVSCKPALIIGVGVVGFIALLVISENALKRNLFHEKEARLSAVVHSTISQIEYLTNTLPTDQAEIQAKALINATRFDGDNYLYVIDTNRYLLAHPNAGLIGKQMGSRDVNAKDHFWFQMVEVGVAGGTVMYPWQDTNGKPADKLAYVDSVPSLGWIVGAGMLTNTINAEINQQYLQMGLITLAISAVMGICGYIISKAIVVPLKAIQGAMDKVAKGDLTAEIPTYGTDEIGVVALQTTKSLASIREALGSSVQSSRNLADAATRIASSAEETSTAVMSQRDQLNQLATAMNQMSTTVAEVANNAESTANDTEEATREAGKGSQDLVSNVESIQSLVTELDSATDQVEKLKEGVMEISEVTSVITGISEQTNLLALNAAIEAARAGEQGRGFAVVADEVRNLAARTSQSTEEIQSTINRLQGLALGTADVMKRSQDLAHNSVKQAESCGSDLDLIEGHIRHVNESVVQIATAAEEQNAVTEDMNRNVAGISDSALEMSQAANHLASESETLADMSRQLDDRLAQFTI
ncbi:methyl-accepting chemotaxis protein [Vibrio sp. RC27]